jgi:DtxR family Mn-dependent transcriptional regulator
MSLPDLSRSEVAYLETIYRLNETHETTSVSALARKFGVKMPSAVEILGKLERKGLVVRKPWGVPELSKRGAALAESVMHQHRILELYLNKKLGLSSELSCAQAGKIDYLLDSNVIDRMCKALNRPSRCVHGNRIQHGD